MHDDPNEAEAVKVVSRRLHQRAKWLSVDVPSEWYVTEENDLEYFIGGLYHDRVRAKLQSAMWRILTSGVGLVGGLLGIAAFVRGC